MNAYLRWNDALAAHFFKPEMAGRPVYLYVTERVINSEVGNSLGGGVAEFVAAVKEGPPWATRHGLCQRALQAYQDWRSRRLDFPPYLAYLALFVLATGVEGDFAPHAYYPRLRELLGDPDPDGGALPSFDRMLKLWDDLETWSVRDKNGELGVFTARIIGGWIHVGLPIAQTILTERERRSLPGIFARAGLGPASVPPDAELARVLRTLGTGQLRRKTLAVLRERSDDEVYGALLETVADALAEWDGTVDESGGGGVRTSRRCAGLRLCLRLDPVSGRARVALRCRIVADFPEERLVLTSTALPAPVWCEEFAQGWSTPLYTESGEEVDASVLDWEGGAVLKGAGPSSAWQASLLGRRARVLVDASSEGLPGLVETGHLPASCPFFLLFARRSWPDLEQWVREQCTGFKELRITEGLPDGWRLARIERAGGDSRVRESYPWLTFPARPRIRLRGGIRHSRGSTFFAFAPPELLVEGGDVSEEVVCEGRILRPSEGGRYRLPPGMPLDSRISIEVRRAGQVIARESLYLVSDFAWRRGQPIATLDAWGRPRAVSNPDDVGVGGAWVTCPRDPPDRFTIRPAMAPGLDTSGRQPVFLIGRRPGEIARWQPGAKPTEWEPVWAVPLARRGRALFCGSRIDTSSPLSGQVGGAAGVREWKRVLWVRRKDITPPPHPRLLRLWREYQEAARRA